MSLFLAIESPAVSFTADAIQQRGGVVSQAKLYWDDGSVRFEYREQGIPMVQIFDNKNRKMIWLDTHSKVYMQTELSDQQAATVTDESAEYFDPCNNFADAECNHLKSAIINGRKTDKWLITFNIEGRDQHIFQWIDRKHRILVRQENPDGSVLDVRILDAQEVNGRLVHKVDMIAISPDGSSIHSIQWYDDELNIIVRQQADDGSIDELRNIQVENVDPTLFAIPEGYRPIASSFTDLNTHPSLSFGTAD